MKIIKYIYDKNFPYARKIFLTYYIVNTKIEKKEETSTEKNYL